MRWPLQLGIQLLKLCMNEIAVLPPSQEVILETVAKNHISFLL
jgi:hypothetical protein